MRVTVVPDYRGNNPYQQRLYSAMPADRVTVNFVDGQARWLRTVRATQPDLVHFHWLDRLVLGPSWWRTLPKGAGFLTQLASLRRDGVAVVWTCHNLVNHLQAWPWFERKVLSAAQTSFDRILVHDPSQADLVAARFGIHSQDRRIISVRHAAFGDIYTPGRTRDEMRQQYDLDPEDDVFLMFGAIQPRKQLDKVLEAFRQADLPSARLVIVGHGKGPYLGQLGSLAERDTRVRFRPGFIEESEVRALHEMSDVVLLPHATALTSGALILAMELGKPVISTRFAHAKAMLGASGKGGHLADDSPDALVEAMLHMTQARHEWKSMGERNQTIATQQTWRTMADQTLGCYESAVEEREAIKRRA